MEEKDAEIFCQVAEENDEGNWIKDDQLVKNDEKERIKIVKVNTSY